VKAFPDEGFIVVKDRNADDAPRNFTFDAVYGPEHEQKYIYDSATGVVDSALNSYNGTILRTGRYFIAVICHRLTVSS
jgi:hypothetical protein